MEVDTTPFIMVNPDAQPIALKVSNRSLYRILLDVLHQLSITLSDRARKCLDTKINNIISASLSVEEMVALFYQHCYEYITEWQDTFMIRKYIIRWMYTMLDDEKRMNYIKMMRNTLILDLRKMRIPISLYDDKLTNGEADIIFMNANRFNKTDVEILDESRLSKPNLLTARNYEQLHSFITIVLQKHFFYGLNVSFLSIFSNENLHGLSWFLSKRSPKRSAKRSPKRSAKRSAKRSPKRSAKRSPKRSAKRKQTRGKSPKKLYGIRKSR